MSELSLKPVIELNQLIVHLNKDKNLTINLMEAPQTVYVFNERIVVLYSLGTLPRRNLYCYDLNGNFEWCSSDPTGYGWREMVCSTGLLCLKYRKSNTVAEIDPFTGRIKKTWEQTRKTKKDKNISRVINHEHQVNVEIQNIIELSDHKNRKQRLMYQDPINEVVHLGKTTFIIIDLLNPQECENLMFCDWETNNCQRIKPPKHSHENCTSWILLKTVNSKLAAQSWNMYAELEIDSGQIRNCRPLTRAEAY